jgi:hypothetical protein
MKKMTTLLTLTALLSSTLTPVTYAAANDTCAADMDCSAHIASENAAPVAHSEEDYANTVALTSAVAAAGLYYGAVPALIAAKAVLTTGGLYVALPVGVVSAVGLLGQSAYDTYTNGGDFLTHFQANAQKDLAVLSDYAAQAQTFAAPYMDAASAFVTPYVDAATAYAHATLPASLLDGSGLTVDNFGNHTVEASVAGFGTLATLYGADKATSWMKTQGEKNGQQKMAQDLQKPLKDLDDALKNLEMSKKQLSTMHQAFIKEGTGHTTLMIAQKDLVAQVETLTTRIYVDRVSEINISNQVMSREFTRQMAALQTEVEALTESVQKGIQDYVKQIHGVGEKATKAILIPEAVKEGAHAATKKRIEHLVPQGKTFFPETILEIDGKNPAVNQMREAQERLTELEKTINPANEKLSQSHNQLNQASMAFDSLKTAATAKAVNAVVNGFNRGGVRGAASPVIHMGIGMLVWNYAPAAIKGTYDYAVYMTKKAVAKAQDYLNQGK